VARVGVVVLAAGRSTRFSDRGAHKLLARLGEAPVVRLSVLAAIDSAVGDVVVVTGAESSGVASALDHVPVRIVHEPAYAEGIAVSLQRGLEAFRGAVDAVMIALGDQPGVRPDAYRRVAARWRETGARIVVPRYHGIDTPAHPTLFDAAVFDELFALRGDVGARSVIVRDATRVASAMLEWPAPRDIDTPDDLALVAAELSARPPDAVGTSSRASSPPNTSTGQ
jgi:molybdenum cofactor cytidylyltransferase